MANPSSSHRDDRDRERVVRERSHHHHRTISSTTLLLILSLVLAVLAVMLSLPSSRSASAPLEPLANTNTGAGLLSMFSPRRSEAIVSRESAVAKREADVASREAVILANALVTCAPPYATVTEIVETIAPPMATVFVKEDALTAPGAGEMARRVEDLLARESKVAEREKDMSRREETLNRREHDAQRRESWIMEQLIAMGNDPTIEEEYIIEPGGTKRRLKSLPSKTITLTETHLTNMPAPSSIRPAAVPSPESFSEPPDPPSAPTTIVEVYVDDGYPESEETYIPGETVTIVRHTRPTSRTPRRWLW